MNAVRIRHVTLIWPKFCLFSQVQEARSLRSVQLICCSSRAGIRSPSIYNIPRTLRKHQSHVWRFARVHLLKKFCIFLSKKESEAEVAAASKPIGLKSQSSEETTLKGHKIIWRNVVSVKTPVTTTEASNRLLQWATQPPIRRIPIYSVCKTKSQLELS